uniref:Minor structural protein n=1 Tax=Siphoviridae sp. ctFBb37 TaxID=2827565 RepID=A0A8S5RSZ1_9CAUD|nr:MAG TPA: Minor structural protein [Siphoviridae sp. ctFBb37]
MYNVSSAFHTAFADYGREIKAKVIFNGQTELDGIYVQEITATPAFDSSDGISVGSACSGRCKIRIYKPDELMRLSGGYFVPYIGIYTGGGDTSAVAGVAVAGKAVVGTSGNPADGAEYVPLGRYYIPADGIEDMKHSWEITGYDQMASLTDQYTPQIDFPATPESMLADVCAQSGLTPPTVTFPDMTIESVFEGTIRQQLGWLAGLCGQSAHFDRDGNLVFKWYSKTTFQVSRDQQYMSGLTRTADGLYTVSSLTTGTEDEPITSGTGLGITSTNPYMNQSVADLIQPEVEISFQPCDVKWRCDPSVEVGDVIQVEGDTGEWLDVCVMEQEIHLYGGLSSTMHSYAPQDADYAMESPTEQRIKRAYEGLTKAMQNATQKIIGAKGGYYELTLDEQGFPIGWTLRDTPTITPNTRMWIMSTGGLGFSKDGGNTISGVALTMDGEINANVITAGQMSAERVTVNGQTLSDFIDASIDDDGHPVLRIGSSASEIVLKEYNDKIGFYDTSGTLLAYWNNNSFELVELSKFRLGPMGIVVQPNGSVSFVGVS